MDLFEHERIISVELPADTYRILVDLDYWENGEPCYLATVTHAVNGSWREVYASVAGSEDEAVDLCRAWVMRH